MEAKDTVMSDEQIVEILRTRKDEILSKPDAWASYRFMATAQAEISFKAGMEKADFEWRTKRVPKIMEQFKKAGIKEVVEWGDSRCTEHWANSQPVRRKCPECWQAFKKSKGIE